MIDNEIDNERLDLSALDPARDPVRWQAMVDATRSRVDGVLAERAKREDDAFYLIASWRRSLIAAAAILLIALIPAEIALEIRESRIEAVHRLVVLSASSVHGSRAPTASEILRTIDKAGPQ
ncbi:MAG TPA: hypothetical protein VNO75_00355 [Gemmatimonadaceae bacterium]|nr:hypothetical protein [Gemmatimonadaceae bacterium]